MFKQRPLTALYLAQFLSAFVDNMILLIASAIASNDHYPDYYISFIRSAFLAAFIVFSPWVGRFADRYSKSKVLIIGNVIKAAGVLLMLFGANSALAYAVVGIGAVVYSPAKYGILPFLTKGETELFKANSHLESYTIISILTGTIAGGYFATRSIIGGLILCILLYGLSVVFNLFIPNDGGNKELRFKRSIPEFFQDFGTLFSKDKLHFSLVGTGSFWMSTAVLQMIIFAWMPIALNISDKELISEIIAATAIGIAIGAFLAPKIIPLEKFKRTIWFGLGLAFTILSFIFIHNLPMTVAMLLLVGTFGGIYIVPMNTMIQQIGHTTVGAGKTIAIQNFIEYSFMFIGTGGYYLASNAGLHVNYSIMGASVVLFVLVIYLYGLLNASSRKLS